MSQFKGLLLAASGALALGSTAASAGTPPGHYTVTISTAATQNMVLSNGVYAPTADGAVLNITDLESALKSANLEVTTGNGTGGSQLTGDLIVDAGFSWVKGHSLTLDAYRSIVINQPVADKGTGALTLTDNDGGSRGRFNYGPKGSIAIWDLSNSLTIDGQAYVLVGDIQTLAADIATNPAGNYALANAYNAGADGTYTSSPIPTAFGGSFDALGNTISNLSMKGTGGLFSEIDGSVSNVVLKNVTDMAVTGETLQGIGALAALVDGSVSGCSVSGSVAGNGQAYTGGLVGYLAGSLTHSTSSASVQSTYYAGGLVGYLASGTVGQSSATGSVTTKNHETAIAGGLVSAAAGGSVTLSYATGAVSVPNKSTAGGLVGELAGNAVVTYSYATGAVSGESEAAVGGLLGANDEDGMVAVKESYSTGAVSNTFGNKIGGVLGYDSFAPEGCGCFRVTYWDTTTSGLLSGVGDDANESGVTGLTTTQLQSGLPNGFQGDIWAEKSSINGGLPYLIANPPSK